MIPKSIQTYLKLLPNSWFRKRTQKIPLFNALFGFAAILCTEPTSATKMLLFCDPEQFLFPKMRKKIIFVLFTWLKRRFLPTRFLRHSNNRKMICVCSKLRSLRCRRRRIYCVNFDACNIRISVLYAPLSYNSFFCSSSSEVYVMKWNPHLISGIFEAAAFN